MAFAVRSRRDSDSHLKSASARLFYRFYNWMSQVEIPPDAGDFRLLDRRVVDAIRSLPERNRFMKGLFAGPGFRQAVVSYERQPRSRGDTKFNYWRLWNFAIDGMTSFSTLPLRVWSYVGGLVGFVSLCDIPDRANLDLWDRHAGLRLTDGRDFVPWWLTVVDPRYHRRIPRPDL